MSNRPVGLRTRQLIVCCFLLSAFFGVAFADQKAMCGPSNIEYNFVSEEPTGAGLKVLIVPEAKICTPNTSGLIDKIEVEFNRKKIELPETCYSGTTTAIRSIVAEFDESGFFLEFQYFKNSTTLETSTKDVYLLITGFFCKDRQEQETNSAR